jgi:hypothetical protein
MRIGLLESVAHNIADSLASGIGLLIGVMQTEIYREASRTKPGFIEVDFLNGTWDGNCISDNLETAIKLYAAALPEFCEKHGVGSEEYVSLVVRYGTDIIIGSHFTVKIEDRKGRKSEKVYVGSPGRRIRKRCGSVPKIEA